MPKNPGSAGMSRNRRTHRLHIDHPAAHPNRMHQCSRPAAKNQDVKKAGRSSEYTGLLKKTYKTIYYNHQ